MPFDEQLRHAFETLADRFRDETKRQLAELTSQLADAVEAERTKAAAQAATEARTAAEQEAAARVTAEVAAAEARGREAVAAAESRAREAGREAGRQEGRETGIREGRETGTEAGRKEGWTLGREEGYALGREEGRQDGRQEGEKAGRQEGRQEGKEEGRQEGRQEGKEAGRQEGRQEGRENARAELHATELAANERLIDAIRAIDGARSLSEILDTLVGCAGREAKRVGVFLVRHGHLRGWRFIGFGAALDERSDFELASDNAGVIADAARTGAARSADSAVTRSTPSFAELPPGREVLAVPVPMSGQVVAVLYADQGPSDVSDAELRVAWPSTLEVMARHAARCLEAITAFRAAQVLTERPDVSPSASIVDSRAGESAKSNVVGEKENADQAARRYARLLVSEIKLYHEAAMIVGCRERDLATRLGGEIARARVLYEQRVPADARRGTDHFHNELVRTLANGDASLLEVKS